MDNSLKKTYEKSSVSVNKIEMSKYGKLTAMLTQTVIIKSEYNAASHSNDMQQNVFSKADFAEKTQIFENTQNRVAFMEVPEGVTVAQVEAKMPADACLYRVYSNAPILHDGHIAAIKNDLTTKDDIADSQAIRYPEGHENEGELILHNDKVQYMTTNFWASPKEDMDLRGDLKYPPYMSEDISDELNLSESPELPDFSINNQEIR